jgi:translocation and assembly module TamB
LPTTPTSSEINDISAINYGTLNTVRIQATIQGRASELSQNLQLTSEPARSEAEIIALLGGSFLNVLGQSNTSLSIFTLAGSPFFTGLQGTISQFGEAIGLRDLRIFPTIITDSSSTSSVLGLAAEAVVGVSRNLSGSISGVFATNKPLRYNIIYRVNNQILLRGSTNLSDESRILIEYEKRF